MPRAADVKSVRAVRAFKKDLIDFQNQLHQTLELLHSEVRRGIEWLQIDRARYWPAQIRRASDAVSEARINLERCQLAIRADERRSCTDEKKALDRAQRRLAYAEQKVRTTKHWLRVVNHEADEFQSRLARLEHMVEHDLPRGIAQLERLARALDRYVGSRSASTQPADGPADAEREDRGEPDDAKTDRQDTRAESEKPARP
jgi:hypothetical protein